LGQSIERQVIGTTGSYSTGPSGSLSSTVGEVVISTGTSPAVRITQGFQQPEASGTTSIGKGPLSVTVQAFPNPSQDALTIHLTGGDRLSALGLRVIAMNGQLVRRVEAIPLVSGNATYHLDVSSLAAGQYLLTLDSQGTPLGNLTFQKR
jgi:hypothetical protein